MTGAVGGVVESLEWRRLLSVSLGHDGWTHIGPSDDTQVVYVSSTAGDDLNTGLSEADPVQSLARARRLVRNGAPDWLLLKRGDVWSESFDSWTKSGRGDAEPMLIGAYGDGARPLLNTGTGVGFSHWVPVAHLAIVGIHFNADARDTADPAYTGTTAGSHGFESQGRLNDVLIENAVFDNYRGNVSIAGYSGRVNDFTIRRSVLTDSWSTDGSGSGLYVHRSDNVTVEENVFDHNGWNETIAGPYAGHAIYMSSGNGGAIAVRGNVIANSGSHGLQARSGGTIENNLFLKNPINLLFGGGSPTIVAGGVTGRVTGNVILDGRDINGAGRGTGMEFSNIKPGAGLVVSNNIMTADTHRRAAAITFGTTSDASNVADAVGLNDLILRDNLVYDWQSGVNVSTSFVGGNLGNLGINNVEFVDNDFQHTALARLVRHGPKLNATEFYWAQNRYDNAPHLPSGWFQVGSTTTSFNTWKQSAEPTAVSVAPAYADPGRSIFTYNASLGGEASFGAFMAAARAQSHRAYDGRYTAPAVINYVRRGFAENAVIPGGLLTVLPSDFSPGEAGDVAETNAPTAPASLAVTGVTGHTVSLTWGAASDDVGVTGYQVFRNGVQVALTTRTRFTDVRVPDGASYTYAVRAFDAARNVSPPSGGVVAATPDVTAPTVPADLVAADPTSTSIALRWTASGDNVGVAGYRVFRNGVQVATTAQLTYTDQGLIDGTRYTYTIKAFDAAGNVSAASESAVGGTDDATSPTTPGSLAVTGVTAASISLSWNAATDNVGVAAYRLYRDGVHVATTPGTTYTDADGLSDGTRYVYTVLAVDAAGNASGASASATGITVDVTAPTVPLDLKVTGRTGYTVSLSWLASSDNVGVSGYRVYRDGVHVATPIGTSYTDAGLTELTSYAYTVVALDAAGNASAESEIATGTTTDATAPTAPANLAVANVTGHSASLSWDAATDNVAVTAYRVFRNGVQINTTTDTTYEDDGLADGVRYTYVVRASDAAGNVSTASNTATATTPDVTAPAAPTNLAVTGTTGTTASLKWIGSTDNVAVAGYQVLRNGTVVATTTGTTTTYTDSGLSERTSYAYSVMAVDAAGNVSSASNFATATTTDVTPPTAPSGLAVTAVTGTSVSLAWNASADNTGVAGYRVFRNGVQVASITTRTFTDANLKDATSYTYTVKGFDAAGNVSAASNSVTATTPDDTPPTAPTSLTRTGVTSSSVSLSWNASTDNKAVTGYRVFRNGVQVASITARTYTDSNLTAGTTYTYVVRAFDAAGNVSAASNSVTGTTTAAAVGPIAPTTLTAAVYDRTRARLTWADRSTNETGFYIYSSRDGVTWKRYATIGARTGTSTTTYTTGVLATGKWYFRISAYNATGESAATNIAQLTI